MIDKKNNLIMNSDLTPKQRKEKAIKAGKKSGEVRSKNKSIREALQAMLRGEYEVDGKKLVGYDAMAATIIKEALNGNVQAFKEIRDTVGEKPTDKINLESGIEAQTELREYLQELKNGKE